MNTNIKAEKEVKHFVSSSSNNYSPYFPPHTHSAARVGPSHGPQVATISTPTRLVIKPWSCQSKGSKIHSCNTVIRKHSKAIAKAAKKVKNFVSNDPGNSGELLTCYPKTNAFKNGVSRPPSGRPSIPTWLFGWLCCHQSKKWKLHHGGVVIREHANMNVKTEKKLRISSVSSPEQDKVVDFPIQNQQE